MGTKRVWFAFVVTVALGCGDGGTVGGNGGDGGAGTAGTGATGTGGGAGSGGIDPSPAPGACCALDTTCAVSDADACEVSGGRFTAMQTCDEVTCPGPSMDDYRRVTRDLEATLAENIEWYYEAVSIVGREYWDLNGDDPEVTNELLGRQGAAPSSNSPFTTRPFAAGYAVVRAAEGFIAATENASFEVTEEQLNAAIGFAKTLQAYGLLLVANHQFENGILPIEALSEVDPSGSFLNHAESLAYVAALLDEAATVLTNGGPAFVFPLGLGFERFDTPPRFRQFNRALLARVRIYQGDKSGALNGIAGSFFNFNGDQFSGPKHVYDGIDTKNPFYHEPDVDLFTVHPTFLTDAVPGDLGVSSNTRPYVPTPTFFVPVALEGLVGDTQVSLVNEDYVPFPILSNGELILIYAESQIGSDVNEVLASINRVRNQSGLGNYLGATDDDALLDEVLERRRYRLYGQGHRWVDLRRTNKLDELPIDRVGDVVHVEFPRPANAVELAVSGF